MEDSKKLIDELLAKLAELDGKVASYRQDMLDQFKKFADDLLKTVPEDVSNEVARVIAESMAKYPSLSMPSRSEPDSPATQTVTEPKVPREGRKSPPPILYHTSGIPKMTKMFRDAGPRSPHDRELEFQGLFTPSYLPLLDGTDRPTKQERVDRSWAFHKSNRPHLAGAPPSDSPPAAQPVQPVTGLNDDDDEVAVVEMVEEVEVADTDKGKQVIRPSPVRELTDVSVSSSVGSASSEHKTRRSALRRSSSSTKGSPRRVRFEFAGEEVLPTASPQQSESMLGTMGGLDLDESGPSSSAIDDSEDYSGPSLSDVEGEEDYVLRPARISSTEALRRLSRTPSDDGTVWKVVNPEDEKALPATNGHGPGDSEASTAGYFAEATSSSAMHTPAPSQLSAAIGSENQREKKVAMANGTHAYELDSPTYDLVSPKAAVPKHREEDSEEEHFLAIRSPKKAMSPSATSPTAKPPTVKSSLAGDGSSQTPELALRPAASSQDKGKGKKNAPAQQPEEEDLFDFDDPSMGMASSATAEKYLSEDEDEEAIAEDAGEADDEAPAAPLNLYSTSPAVSIPRRKTPSPPTHSKPMYGSIGSYKGAPLRMSVVVSPRIAEEAAAMGDVKTYVGSVHGRTGIDPADESSYRASFSNAKLLSGTPRSFSERMMMEEAMGKDDEDDVD
ncbi:hypothetical protein CONLIGDRAFT_164330 [Coniochaeta ligniaria NRRL 30616]|uniref:Uncharacterized protein n=1 Tax=Coniochaeta ligniaria NRRL 30616 TaxID=1408157 RepID=A0A1J7JIM4_9PEZI|nr:hypothetical protein CONLIGDRAFT_164330 [Coniochaeta ligniaria NRRL 30616]